MTNKKCPYGNDKCPICKPQKVAENKCPYRCEHCKLLDEGLLGEEKIKPKEEVADWEIDFAKIWGKIVRKEPNNYLELKSFITKTIAQEKDKSYQMGITEGMNLLKETYESNKQHWEKEAVEKWKEELIKELDWCIEQYGLSSWDNILWHLKNKIKNYEN